MKENKNFGKMTNGEFAYAPRNLEHGGKTYCNCKEPSLYYAEDFRDVAEVKPDPVEGYRIVVDRYEQEEDREDYRGKIIIHYKLVMIPIPKPLPRRWTPLTIKRAADKEGIWDSFKELFDANNAYEDFLMCQYVSEDDPLFIELRKALVAKYGENMVEKFINGLEVE